MKRTKIHVLGGPAALAGALLLSACNKTEANAAAENDPPQNEANVQKNDPPKKYGDPLCKEDCPSIGFCWFEGGRCQPKKEEDCQQSLLCKNQGGCSLHHDRGAPTCVALTADDCKDSLACKEHGKCEAADGMCISRAKSGEGRKAAVDSIRRTAWAAAQDCESMKRKVIPLLSKNMKDPRKEWEEPQTWEGGLELLRWRSNSLPTFEAATNMTDNNCDLLERACCSKLKDEIPKVREQCFFDGRFKDLSWILEMGGTDCGPATAQK